MCHLIKAADILGASIQVVDDNEANVLLLARMSRGAGFTSIISTMSPQHVCEPRLKIRYSLILLDLQRRGMDGFQVIDGVKEIETPPRHFASDPSQMALAAPRTRQKQGNQPGSPSGPPERSCL